MELNFKISGEFINEQILNLVDEQNYASAFKVAYSCLGNPELSQYERIGLAFSIMFGEQHLIDNDDSTLALEASSAVNLEESIANIFSHYKESIEENERENRVLSAKLGSIYDSLITYNAQALKEACVDWMDSYECRDGVGFLFDKEHAIPKEVYEAVKLQTPWLYNPDGSFKKNSLDDGPCFEGYSKSDDSLMEQIDSIAKTLNESSDKPLYGWLAPDGSFTEVDWGEHEGWAREWLEENDREFKATSWSKLHECGDELVKRGWVLLHSPMRGVGRATVNKNKPLTDSQKDFLYNYYKGWDEIATGESILKGSMSESNKFIDLIEIR